MTRAALVATAFLMCSAFASSSFLESTEPEAGVPLALAQERAARMSNLRYDVSFHIPEEKSQPVRGRVSVRFDLRDPTRPVALDFAGPADSIGSATVNGRETRVRAVNEHIVIPAALLVSGPNEMTVGFTSADAPLNRNADYLYALFVPARARQAFPCFDQPDLKAKYTVSLNVPAGWEAISNGAEMQTDTATGGRRGVRFAETQPISTYLFTFAAGRFRVETAARRGRTFRMLHRETDAAKVSRNRDQIFDLHDGALAWLERYTGISYPFGKFDFVLVPAFQFGGMEHPGSVYYKASSLLLDVSATQDEKLGRASLIAHETAHMWFGDLVTMKWFNDVWTKEVFANFMAAKIVAPAFPNVNHDLRFLYAHYPGAYEVDRTPGTNAIRQELHNLNEAGSLYGAIIYQKAPIVMRQLETILGADAFRDGMREYLKAHAFGNATWHDLIAALDPRTPEDLVQWSRAWVEETGRPTITTTVERAGATAARITLSQTDSNEARGLLWSQRLRLAVGGGAQVMEIPVRLDGASATAHASAKRDGVPLYVLPTAGGVGYGNFVLDPASRKYLLAHLSAVKQPLLRGAALITLWEEMLDGRVQPGELMEMLLTSVPRERDELNVARLLGYTRHAYWKFLDERTRGAAAPRLEKLLRAGLAASPNASLKAAWFNALRDTATTPGTVSWLERVWRRKESVPGLVLAEPDFISLAQALAVRGVQNSSEILDAQIARTENPDRKAQMIFVRPALAGDERTRDAFFATLRDAGNRRHETWVLEALGYLHHPLRAARSEKHIPASLELLREIQRTGDIFFPKRWMDATLSGHTSPAAAATVKAFLDTLPPDYPDRLRRVILSSSDDLVRASKRASD